MTSSDPPSTFHPPPSTVGVPPTVFVVHPKERRSKCSIEPLRGDERFVFETWTESQPGSLAEPPRTAEGVSLAGYVRLGMDGPLLSEADADSGLLLLDGTWRYADVMTGDYAFVPSRSLPAWKTAYPRVSDFYDDPQGGLATVEALFAAYVHLGRSTDGLLNDYYWRDAFLELNRERITSGDADAAPA